MWCIVQVLVDGLLVYTGTVPSVPTHARGILPTLRPPLDPFLIPLCGGGACGVGSAGDVHLSERLVCRDPLQRVFLVIDLFILCPLL